MLRKDGGARGIPQTLFDDARILGYIAILTHKDQSSGLPGHLDRLNAVMKSGEMNF